MLRLRQVGGVAYQRVAKPRGSVETSMSLASRSDDRMKRSPRPKLHAGPCVLCALVGATFSEPFQGTEFSGGFLTGRILGLHDASLLLFVASAGLAFVDRRLAIIGVLFGCLLALPLYAYLVAPGPFRALFPGNYKDPLNGPFTSNARGIGAFAAIIILTMASVIASRRRITEYGGRGLLEDADPLRGLWRGNWRPARGDLPVIEPRVCRSPGELVA